MSFRDLRKTWALRKTDLSVKNQQFWSAAVLFLLAVFSGGNYYEKSGQYASGERRDTQQRRFVAELYIVEF